MLVAVVASGDLAPEDARILDVADLVVAADGGADRLAALGRRPDRVVGDMDSVAPSTLDALVADGVHIERHPVDKDSSDAALAVSSALAAGADRLVLLGALGGERIDHAIANLLLLADSAISGAAARIVHGRSIVRLTRPGIPLDLEGERGDLATLLPAGDGARGVTTFGLRWPLEGADLAAGSTRGLSNEIAQAPASVRVDAGRVFVIEHRMQREEPNP